MFKAAQTNPYDDIVAKATDENQTSENWEIILNLCDKVSEEGEQGARNVIAALLKRLTHRNANVQLYSLTLAEALTKNCDINVHREIASRAFTQALEKIVNDRTTHDKVRRRVLSLIAQWASEFESDPTLGIMEETYKNLEAKNYRFDAPQDPPPPEVNDEARRREEEELQRVLEMSMHDKGRDWAQYSAYGSKAQPGSSSTGTAGSSKHIYAPPPASSGYVPAVPTNQPARSPSPKVQPPAPGPQTTVPTGPQTAAPQVLAPSDASAPIVTRVRALHTFEPTEAGELAFEKGDIIKVVDRGYKDWWRGQLKGRTGIFPVNYVEPLPEPTADQLAKEAQQEASVFGQAANVDKLLTLLRQFDADKDNLADNEEIQELYRTSMGLRPKIVKLIDKYSQKRADLVSMNESFGKARAIYERMMEQSLARVTEVPQAQPSFQQQYQQYQPQGHTPGPQPYGYPGYEQPAYPGYPQQTPGPQQQQPYGPQYAPAQPGAPYPSATPAPGTYPAAAAGPHPGQLQTAPASAPQGQPQQQTGQPQGQVQGPPYVFDPNATYPDPNAQAWAQYYAQGGKDETGAIYFISVPGVKEGPPGQQPPPQPPAQGAPGPAGAPGGYPPQQPGYSGVHSPHQPHHEGSIGYAGQPQYSAPGGPQAPAPGSPTQFTGQQPHPSAAPGPYAPGPQGGGVYPPTGYDVPQSPAGPPGSQYQGLPGMMAGMSLGPDGQPTHAPPGI